MSISKSEYKLVVFGALLSITFTAIYDWVKEKPVLSTLFSFLKWIWNNIFEFEIKLWNIIVIIITISVIRNIIKDNRRKHTIEKKTYPDWYNYVEKSIDGIKWKWYWEKNVFGKWNIENLRPLCNNCETSMKLNEWSSVATCPRCEKYISGFKDTSKIEAIIIDDVQRNLYEL